jgi:hypothetical protein
VVGDDRFERILGHLAEHPPDLRHLLDRDPAVLAREAPCRVETEHRQLIVAKEAGRVSGRLNVLLVFGERREKAGEHIVKRHVVVARDDQLRLGDAVEKAPRFGEFGLPRALREVAAQRHHVRFVLAQAGQEALDDRALMTAEMEVRYVRDRPHGGCVYPAAGAGAKTRSASGLIR